VLILGTEHVAGAAARAQGIADRTDGLALMGGTIPDDGIERLASRSTLLVTMARTPIPGIPNVRVDNYASTVALTTHLLHEHHFRDLAFAGEVADSPDKAGRWSGFVAAHRDAGLDPPAAPLYPAWDQHSGIDAAQAVLDLDRLPDAVVCGNDEIAIGMLCAFAAAGIRVPHDIAITGWDNITHSEFTTPALTTVTQPARTLGQATARILLGLIRDSDRPPPAETVLSTEPVVRASCGCSWKPDYGFPITGH
jgi:LacI family transcriptional regulator